MPEFDAIVVGLGGAGSASAYHLARSGGHVLGIEQFGPNHLNGSSHGRTRIYRTAYSEGPVYVPLTQRAQRLWHELQHGSKARIIQKTGGLYIGRPAARTIAGARRSAEAFSLPGQVLERAEVQARFPQFLLHEDEVAFWDPDAGALFPENCMQAHVDGALQHGAELHYGEAVRGWRSEGDSVTVATPAGEYRARSLVLTAGSWTSGLLTDLGLPLEVERQFVLWFSASRADFVTPDRMPVFIFDRRPGLETYGLPDFGEGVKVGAWAGKKATTPESADRELHEADAAPVRNFVHDSIAGVEAREREWMSCLMTMAPDHDFLIGRHPRYPSIVLVSACSGHGFKFASVVGEVVSRLVNQADPGFDLSAFDPGRFAPKR